METLSEEDLESIADWLSERLDEVAGYAIRIDAGEEGRVWIALRGARGDEEARRELFETLESRLDDRPDGLVPPFEPRISSGHADDDLVLICECYRASGQEGRGRDNP